MDRQKTARSIAEKMGGPENIRQSWHCITRLRFNFKDKEKIDLEGIKAIDGIMGAQFQSGQFQIIIGGEVNLVFEELEKILGDTAAKEEEPSSKKGNLIEQVLDVISGIFTPLLPAITGGGILKGIMALLVFAGVLTEGGSNHQILSFIADAPFHFLPFLVAFSAAKKFRTNESLAVTLAGVLMYPAIMEYAAGGEIASLSFLGVSIPMNSYSSSVLPIILGVWLMSYVDKGVNKIVPKSLKMVFSPLLIMLITAPITLKFIGPLGSTVGVYLEMFFTKMFEIAGPFAGALMGGIMPIIVITGMHYAFFPSTFASFDKFGYDIMLLPLSFVSNIAQAGATFGVFLKTKDKKMKQVAFSSSFTAIFGITEPAIYGVTMKLKKPFYAALIGGAAGGAIFGAFSVKAFAFTLPGVMSLATYIEEGTSNFTFALLGVSLSFVISAIMAMILKFDESEALVEGEKAKAENSGSEPAKKAAFNIVSPVSGSILPLESVPDVAFSEGTIGKGVAIKPTEGIVKSPFKGKVATIAASKHAIGIVSEEGPELLIHVGIDTVSLEGKGFHVPVKENQEINQGDVLIEFDMDFLNGQGISLVTPVIVTNFHQYLDIIHTSENTVKAEEDKLLMIIF